jgi:hypothetical protein
MTTNTLIFKKIQLLIDAPGGDQVSLTLADDTPTPYPVMKYEGHASIHVQAGYGLEWVRKAFGRDPDEIISMKTGLVNSAGQK